MQIKTAIVPGGGAAGVNVASALVGAGVRVTLIEPDEGAADRARHYLRGSGERVNVVSNWQGKFRADLVFDAIPADDPLRAVFFGTLMDKMPLPIMLATTGAPEDIHGLLPVEVQARLVGFRFSEPGHMRRLVEIGAGQATGPDCVSDAFDLARRLGKIPVSVRAGQAPLSLRLLHCLFDAVEDLLLRGAIPHELDDAMVAFGFDLGPCQAQDLVGLDALREDRKRFGRPETTAPITDRMVQEGRLGKKVGVGWYRYPGGGGAVIDPLIEDLIAEEARFVGVSRREFTPDDMRNCLLLALFHEGVALLAEGVASDASEIDLVSVHGLGFPEKFGGIMSFGKKTPGLDRELNPVR